SATPNAAAEGVEDVGTGTGGGLAGGDSNAAAGPSSSSGEASLRRRLSAGALAALGSIGTGIGISSDNPPGEVDDASVPATGNLSSDVEVETNDVTAKSSVGTGISGYLPSGDKSVAAPAVSVGAGEASLRPRLAADRLAAWDAVGAGTGLSGNTQSGEPGDVSTLPAGELAAGLGAKLERAKVPVKEVTVEAARAGTVVKEPSPAWLNLGRGGGAEEQVEQEIEPQVAAFCEAPAVTAAATSAAGTAAAGTEPEHSVLASTVAGSETVASDKAAPVGSVSNAGETSATQRSPVDPGLTPKAGKVRAHAAALERANSTGVAPVASLEATATAAAAAADMKPRGGPEAKSPYVGGVDAIEASVVAAMENSIKPEATAFASRGEDVPTTAAAA
ncbi:unnamed protein product, partial [Pylaiella littoralis]